MIMACRRELDLGVILLLTIKARPWRHRLQLRRSQDLLQSGVISQEWRLTDTPQTPMICLQ